MKSNKYKISSYHDVHEDSFTEGECDWVNGYEINSEIKALTPEEAITKYFEELGYKHKFDKNNVEDGFYYYDVLVDVDNNEILSSYSDYKKWQLGEIKLWNNNVRITIEQIIEIKL